MRKVELTGGRALTQADLNRSGALPREVMDAAEDIVRDGRARGDAAVRDYCTRFDGGCPESFRVPDELVKAAPSMVDPEFLESLTRARDQILAFHQKEREESWFTTRPDGTLLGVQVTPVASAAVYVPGGRAQYPSTVLMDTIPAKVAGVPRVVMVTPPQRDGSLSAYTLAAAALAGVDEVYAVGGAQAIGACDPTLPDCVLAAVERLVVQSPREEVTRASLDNRGVIVVADTLDAAAEAVNVVAPEHLELHCEDAMGLLGKIRNAGAIFVGAWSSEPLGDYVAGPNHTLPTGGTAKFSNPLGVYDFVKRSSVISYTPAGLAADGPAVQALAQAEGLWAHALSVGMRRRLAESGEKRYEDAAAACEGVNRVAWPRDLDVPGVPYLPGYAREA